MVARFVILLFVFQYVLNAKAFRLAFAQESIMPGDNIVVLWYLDGANIQQFMLELRIPVVDTLLDSQSVNMHGNDHGQAEFSSENMKPGKCYAEALANSTFIGDTGVTPLKILDPSATSTSTSTSTTVGSSSPSMKIAETTSSSSSPSTTITNSDIPSSQPQINKQGSTGNTESTAPITTPSSILSNPTGFSPTSSPSPSITSTSLTTTIQESDHPALKRLNLAVILGPVLGLLAIIIVFVLLLLRRRLVLHHRQSVAPDPYPQTGIPSPRWTWLDRVSVKRRGTDGEITVASDGDMSLAEIATRYRRMEQEIQWWRMQYTPEWNPNDVGQGTVTGAPPTYSGAQSESSVEVPVRLKQGEAEI